MAVSAKAAIDFESSMLRVAKTTGIAGEVFGDNASPLANFGQALRNLSMRIPINVNELARIAELGGQLGIQTPNLIAFTETIAAMGVATNLSTQEAGEGMAKFINIMGSGQDQFETIGSIIVELGNKTAATESDILGFGTRIAGVGRIVGATEDEILGLAAGLVSLGIPAERGGTAIQRMLLLMDQAITSGDDKLRAFADTAGMTMDEFVTAFRDSPIKAFEAFVRGLDRVEERGESAFGVLKRLNVQEQRTIQVLLTSAGGWETIADALDLANQEAGEGNALAEEAARQYGSTASQVEMLANTVNDLRIELGGMILGSGGLTAAIDVLREFFRLLKDNAGSLASMAQGLALLASVRIALGLGSLVLKAKELIIGLKGIATASTGAALGTQRLQAAMVLSNVAIGAATIGIMILVTSWVNASIKAAELRMRVRALNDEIEAGADPVDIYIEQLKEQNILTEERRNALADLNISEERFAQAMLSGADAESLLNDELSSQFGFMTDLQESIKGVSLGWLSLNGIVGGTDQALITFSELAADATEDAEGLLGIKTSDFVNAMIEAGLSVGKTREEMERTAKEAIQAFGFDLSESDFIQMITGTGIGGKDVRRRHLDSVTEDVEAAATNWRNALANLGEGREELEGDFWDAIADDAEDFRTDISDAFSDLKEVIFEGFPTSEDYEQQADLTRDGLAKIIAAQDAYILDLGSWLDAQDFLRQNASLNAQEWFAGLDTATQGAFGRLFEERPEVFNQFLADVETNFGQMNELLMREWAALEPGILAQRFQQTFATALMNIPEEMKAVPAAYMGMLQAGLTEAMISMPMDTQDEFVTFLEGMFGSEAFLTSLGFEKGDPIVQGFLAALRQLAGLAAPIVGGQVRAIGNQFDFEAEVESPSKMTYRTGVQIAKGLFAGMEDEFARNLGGFKATVEPIMSPLSQTGPMRPMSIPAGMGGGGNNVTYHNVFHMTFPGTDRPQEMARRTVEEFHKRLRRYGAERKV